MSFPSLSTLIPSQASCCSSDELPWWGCGTAERKSCCSGTGHTSQVTSLNPCWVQGHCPHHLPPITTPPTPPSHTLIEPSVTLTLWQTL